MKILHFIYGLHLGGAESFLLNIARKLNPDEYHFDFAIQDSNITNQSLADLIKDNGWNVYVLSKFTRSIIGQYRILKKILRENQYDYLHIHMNAAINPVPLIVSFLKIEGLRIIVHSHNSSNNLGGFVGRLLHKINSRYLINEDTICVACSDLAGKWMFGNRPFIQIDNAIDANSFGYNTTDRKSIRNELGISSSVDVIGSVARFVAAKNHKFMINWFAEYSTNHNNAVLLLVGDGKSFDSIKRMCDAKEISDKVIFTGPRTDINRLLSTMDCFLLPSLFEGFGIAAIEAQASGLHVVAADSVPSIINIKGHTSFLSLKSPYGNWNSVVDNAIFKTKHSDRTNNPVLGSRFDVNNMIEQLKKVYI